MDQKLYKEMIDDFKTYLEYVTDNNVSRNKAENSLSSLIEFVFQNFHENDPVLETFYEMTHRTLQLNKNERQATKLTLKLARKHLDHQNYDKLIRLLSQLHQALEPLSSSSSSSSSGQQNQQNSGPGSGEHLKGNVLLEVYELEIYIYTAKKDDLKLRSIYKKALAIKDASPHPRILAVIKECGAKLHMIDHQWDAAWADFMEAFKRYDEAGLNQRINCLKYMVLANLLALSKFNPFDDQAAAAYKNNDQIVAMTQLVDAYEQDDLKRFEAILSTHSQSIVGDDQFIHQFLDQLIHNIRSKALQQFVRPYSRVSLDFLARHFAIPSDQIEHLLRLLIANDKIRASIDQQQGVLLVQNPTASQRAVVESQRFDVLSEWADELARLHKRQHSAIF